MGTNPLPDAITTGASTPTKETVRNAPKPKDYALLARMVVREGKTFKESAIASGFAESTACAGLKSLVEMSQPAAEAIKRETESVFVSLDKLKPFAVRRLYEEIRNPTSSNGMKAIEIAGKFKETDWFVRNNDANLGILINIGEQAPEPAIDALDVFKE